jgi:D-alanyl-D-alanine carboxypeptidase
MDVPLLSPLSNALRAMRSLTPFSYCTAAVAALTVDLAETLDGSKILAELNSDVPFNPASVMKVATSFFAFID